jgi:hypothetical protein
MTSPAAIAFTGAGSRAGGAHGGRADRQRSFGMLITDSAKLRRAHPCAHQLTSVGGAEVDATHAPSMADEPERN